MIRSFVRQSLPLTGSLNTALRRSLSCTSSPACPCKTPGLGLGLSNDLILNAQEAVKANIHELCNVKFVDCSYISQHNSGPTRDLLQEFNAKRIPNSTRYKIDDLCNPSSSLSNALPTEEQFEKFVSEELGISSTDHVIIYQRNGSIGGARAWWTFRLMGHRRVSYLDGGLDAWIAAGGPIHSESDIPLNKMPKTDFKAFLNKSMLVGLSDVERIVQSGSAQILDARSNSRFLIEEGHIPGSLNLPYTSIVESSDSTKFRSSNEIRDAFVDAGLIFGSRTVLSCGSGVTACILALGLQIIGKDITKGYAVYNGSWGEWGSHPTMPKIKA
jgi:thiosulfate/3-mercaptopyruvate sulfurtransferase